MDTMGTIWEPPLGVIREQGEWPLQPILNPGGYLPLHSGDSTVLLSDKKNGYTVEY